MSDWESKTNYELLSTVEGKPVSRDILNSFPGNRRFIPGTQGPPPDMVLIKTGGNALQAVHRRDIEEKNMMAVSVPEGVRPGDEILVRTVDGSGRILSSIVPTGALPGHTFLIQMPPNQEPALAVGVLMEDCSTAGLSETLEATQVVAGHDVESNDLRLLDTTNEPFATAVRSDVEPVAHLSGENLVLVMVPEGASKGDTILVPLSDGRTIKATVPDANLTKFYLQVPPSHQRQNWHDSSLAVAPMTFGPFLT
jgi:hypothetical protein